MQQGEYYGPENSYPSHEPQALSEAPPPQATSQRPPSPGRRSMFDFVSPFDALNSPSSQQSKRKPVPPQNTSSTVSGTEDSSWTAISSMDPKRKSVENLIDQLTRGQGPLTSQPQASPSTQFDPYVQSEELTPQTEQSRASRPLPPHPTQLGPGSAARESPPKGLPPQQPQVQQQRQQARRSVDSPIGPPAANQAQYAMAQQRENQRGKEGSPLPSGARLLSMETRAKPPAPKGKTSPRYVDSVYCQFIVN